MRKEKQYRKIKLTCFAIRIASLEIKSYFAKMKSTCDKEERTMALFKIYILYWLSFGLSFQVEHYTTKTDIIKYYCFYQILQH